MNNNLIRFKKYLDQKSIKYEWSSDSTLLVRDYLDGVGSQAFYCDFEEDRVLKIFADVTTIKNSSKDDILEYLNEFNACKFVHALVLDDNTLRFIGSTILPVDNDEISLSFIISLSCWLGDKIKEIYPDIMKIIYR